MVKALDYLNSSSELDLVGVVTQPPRPAGRKKTLTPTPVADYAAKNNLNLQAFENVSASDSIDILRSWKVDVFLTAAYGQILKKSFLELPTITTANLHPSLLPKYRGATPVQTALFNGDKETGISLLHTVRALDAGPIISQSKSTIGKNENQIELMERLFLEGAKLFEASLPKIHKDFSGATPQNEDEISHCKKIKKEMARVDWASPADVIHHRFRAFFGWPGSFGFLGDRRIAIDDCLPASLELESGKLFYDKAQKKLYVGCGEGSLELITVKPAGKKSMPADAFARSLDWKSEHVFST